MVSPRRGIVARPSDDQTPLDDSWEALTAQADIVDSADLETKEELEGVPMLITELTFRPTTFASRWYVSVVCRTQHNPKIVFNDGSTGIRHQLLDYCVSKNVAIIPDEQRDKAEAEPYNLDYYDFQDGDSNIRSETRFDSDARVVHTVYGLRLYARKGLRLSEYIGPEGPAKTYYLA